MREIVTTSVGGDAYDVNIKGRFTVRMDQPESVGGTDTGPNPTDVWVASLGACVAYYAGKYLRKNGLPDEVRVTTTYKMGIGPARVTRIDIATDAPGLPADHRDAFQTAIEGCTIHNSLHQPPAISITTG